VGRPVTYTAPPTVSTGGTSTAAQFNAALRDDVAAMASKAEISLVNPTGYTLAASTTAKLPLDTLISDSPDTMVDLVNNRLVIKQAGTYRVRIVSLGTTGFTWTQFVRKNGSGSLMSQAYAFGLNYELDWAFAFAVNDYIEFWYTNSNGSTILLTDQNLISPYPDGTVFGMRAEWVAP
jgi:hypothetical protein